MFQLQIQFYTRQVLLILIIDFKNTFNVRAHDVHNNYNKLMKS